MSKLIDQAFGADKDLRQRIQTTIQSTPTIRPLFEDIASYHLRHSNAANGGEFSDEPAAKKRKLANGALPIHEADAKCAQVLEIKDVSFSIPQRKKLHFRVVQYTSADRSTIGVQAVSPASGQVEYELPGAEIAQVLRLPVPEKATKQFNYLFIARPGSSSEPILFTVPATPLKAGTFTLPSPATTLDEALAQILKPHQLSLTLPDENEFSSAVPEAHRKSEKAYHVKAFRGSKDGFLFFLSNGIFFGFKKPLLFLAFEDIESISYTSVLQRTFNLNIAFRKPGGDAEEPEEEEIEFSMLDQADYAGINEYVQRHGLNDASLAAGRRAKSEIKKKGAANGEGAGEGGEDDDGRTELEKAQQQMDDDEEEDDDDFDPDDDDEDGDASGSGSEDDSEDEVYEAKGKKSKDLVKDELGSEAEDVEVTDDEEGEADGEEGEEDGEEGEEGEEDEDEEMAEPEPESKPVVAPKQQQQPVVTGRWGAPINKEPDPDDEDQL